MYFGSPQSFGLKEYLLYPHNVLSVNHAIAVNICGHSVYQHVIAEILTYSQDNVSGIDSSVTVCIAQLECRVYTFSLQLPLLYITFRIWND